MRNNFCTIGLLGILVTWMLFPYAIGHASGSEPPVRILWQDAVTPDDSWRVSAAVTVDPQAAQSHLVFMA
ncbi:MAG: hypothetical protein ACFNWY_04755 [Negativicutes bacterium]